jgi:hypothetical protein
VKDLDINQPSSKSQLAIIEATKIKEVRFVDALIQYGAIVQVKDPNTGMTPLHVAFSLGLTDMSKMLLSYGADPNATDKKEKKAIDVAASASIKEMYAVWLKEGAMAFEDPPGTWTKMKDEKGNTYYHSEVSREGRWNVPPSLAWTRSQHPSGPSTYSNFVTNQTVHHIPPALSWRRVKQAESVFWYNWASNSTQLEAPDELPADMLEEAEKLTNLRWYNSKTQQYAFEDPKLRTAWREVDSEGKTFYYNIVSGESQWEIPAELAWDQVEKDNQKFWFNAATGESTWEAPEAVAWEQQTGDL